MWTTMHNIRKRLDIEQKQTSILLDLFIDSMVFHPIHFDYRHVLQFLFLPLFLDHLFWALVCFIPF